MVHGVVDLCGNYDWQKAQRGYSYQFCIQTEGQYLKLHTSVRWSECQAGFIFISYISTAPCTVGAHFHIPKKPVYIAPKGRHCYMRWTKGIMFVAAAALIWLFPVLLRKSKFVFKSKELVWFVNQDTCCQFVSVVWLKEGLEPDSTSMLSLAEEDKEQKHADSAFYSAIFPSCSHSVGALPAGGETVDSWERSP